MVLPTALLSPAPQVCSASGGSLSSTVFFLLNQPRRDYTFLEDVSITIGKFHPAFRCLLFFLFACFWAEFSASYISTEELLLKTKSIAGKTNSSGKVYDRL